MATIISSQGASRPAPRWWRNLERGMLLILIPAATVIIQSWGFNDEKLALKINLMVNTGLAALIKFIGMMLVDTDDNYISNLPEKEQQKLTDMNVPPVKANL
jgi:hypothetical protein